ncbi:hypothetical protein ACC771_14845, partial [Rhizobium ruizarguesonis]
SFIDRLARPDRRTNPCPAIESAHHPVSARNPDMSQACKNPLTHRQFVPAFRAKSKRDYCGMPASIPGNAEDSDT